VPRATPTDLGLLRDAQRMTTVDHRVAPKARFQRDALSNPALVSAPSKKLVLGLDPGIVLQGQFADLGVRRLHVHGRSSRRRAVAVVEHIRGAAFELRLPRRHLVRMNVELPGDLSDRPIALDRRDRHPRVKPEDRLFALKAGEWFRLGRLVIESS